MLRALITEVEDRTNGAGLRNERDVGPEVRAVKEEWLEEWMPQLTSNEDPINQYRIIWDLMHNVDRSNTIITHDAGSPRDQLTRVLGGDHAAQLHGLGQDDATRLRAGHHHGGQARRAGQAVRQRYGRRGDRMVGMDLETAARNRIGILTIVWNNGVMGYRARGYAFAIENYASHTLGGNYGDVARALGGWGVRITKPAEFVPALKEAVEVTKTGQPALIECIVKEGFDFSRYP